MSRLLVVIGLLAFAKISGQERCGVDSYNRHQITESTDIFENWLKDHLARKNITSKRIQANSYTVRVVVHIIHKGELLGSGTNLSDDQIKSQIIVLNKDFNRQNADASQTPSEFQSLSSALNITFELTSITRTKGLKNSWTLSDEMEIKSTSYLPSEDYINIWVCDITDYYGYTQFPVSTLPGLDDTAKDRLTDGILISYQVFGSNDYGAFPSHNSLNKGRTLVHEMGHFLGLRHIWGDQGGCAGTDYVDDTPTQSDRTRGCPTHPQMDCSSNKMFQNYMDLSDDACMNLFTKGQVERMKIVLENSPRRASLLLPLGRPLLAGIPKLFSPNSDGINDYWIWENTNLFNDCTLFIFNKFGQKVYEKKAYDNTWDGRASNGIMLEPEAYYFVIRCPDVRELGGGVRIIR